MNTITTYLFIVVLFFAVRAQASSTEPNWHKTVGAQSFPAKTELFCVNNASTMPDTINNWAPFIQQTIDKCQQHGGGIVYFKPGTYRTGSVFIKENVNFRIDEDVTLQGIANEAFYPLIHTRIAGVEMEWPAALVNIIGVQNAAITGKGTIDGEGKYFWDKFWNMFPEYDQNGLRWALDYDCQRPRLILVSDSKNITLKNTRLEEPGFWTVHLLYSENVTVDSLIIRNNIDGHGPSSDGIDIDSSTRILVQNCDIDCNDDNFCLKAGKDADGLRVNRPTEYVLIRDCIARAGHGLITFGSETSGGIRHIFASNLKATGTLYGIRLKSAKTRGGIIENVHISNIEMDDVFVPIRGTLNWFPKYSYSKLPQGVEEIPEHWKTLAKKVKKKDGIPTFRNFTIENIKATRAGSAIEVTGLKESKISGFVIVDTHIDCKRPGYINYVSDWTFDNVTIVPLSNEALTEENADNIKWINQ
ncbi:MAG TPA: glycosyl hydrolase family 28 protein [Prolixibacteraceae bacterium]|nr:glycosyl hydrolase family 28 protein [Prolixibacteraceae bacterium]